MSFILTEPKAGIPAITDHSLPVTVETVGSTAVTSVKVPLGTVVRAVDPTYGEGEFIRLVGVGTTVVGSIVVYNKTTWATVLAVLATHKNLGMPCAVAMSACVANEHGWYQISGLAVIKKTGVSTNPGVAICMSATGGRFKVAMSAGGQILGAATANLTTVVTTTSTVVVAIDRPHVQGQIT